MGERDHGWPKNYNWPEYLEGQIELTKANRAEEILREEIASLEDKDEQQRALTAWKKLEVQHTLKTVSILKAIEGS